MEGKDKQELDKVLLELDKNQLGSVLQKVQQALQETADVPSKRKRFTGQQV